MPKPDLEELSRPDYWDKRYDGGEDSHTYDWLRNFGAVQSFFEKHLPASDSNPKILQLGCGNSTLTADLAVLGYQNQVSIDFSVVVIDKMKLRHPDLDWRVMDVRNMDLTSESFDVAIDKATLDAMLYGSLWDPGEEVRLNVRQYVDEVARVLKPGGTWLYITWRQPHFIKPLLSREGVWTMDIQTLDDPHGAGGFEYFSFIMTKTCV